MNIDEQVEKAVVFIRNLVGDDVTIEVKKTQKWYKIVKIKTSNGKIISNSVYCFICATGFSNKTLGVCRGGDIHKPASYNMPAKHARGSIFDESTWKECFGPYGVAYLK